MTSPVYVELVNFMAARNPESFMCFELSEMARERLAELKDRWRTGESLHVRGHARLLAARSRARVPQ